MYNTVYVIMLDENNNNYYWDGKSFTYGLSNAKLYKSSHMANLVRRKKGYLLSSTLIEVKLSLGKVVG